ncbi:exo-1,3-beta-glucanase D [Aspergillus eucalypticola CBS 122712]|uniref:glucan 1,3-beta-glucosidase n=1 Tax=Aspergillus eucalypticola (strain CBS 122712 / IBT 29274) TaxID=1448314 RepID=A0A317WEM5_ASPEC|nr:exo-1,3-beta-glucanase D [Aspergillus eucalypticola CBS 122712]PWY82680.1 exo-1,3-beta-glucanase D [Aspergillus eucalypticola CBS 122712]
MPSHSRVRDRLSPSSELDDADPVYSPSVYQREHYNNNDSLFDSAEEDYARAPRNVHSYETHEEYHDDDDDDDDDVHEDDHNREFDDKFGEPWVPLRAQVQGDQWREGFETAIPKEEDVTQAKEYQYHMSGALGDDGPPPLPSDSLGNGKGKKRLDRETRRQRRKERLAAFFKHKNGDASAGLVSGDALAKLLGSQDGDEDCLSHLGSERADSMSQKNLEGGRQRKLPVLSEEPMMLRPFPAVAPTGQTQGRVVSGAQLEQGGPGIEMRHRGGGGPPTEGLLQKESDWDGSTKGSSASARPSFWKRYHKTFIFFAILIVMAAIAIPVGIIEARRLHGTNGADSSSNSNLEGISRDSIPAYARGTYLDPFTWYDTTDFNVTFTNATVGGLSIMGLNSTWNDSAQANENVPPLDEKFPYGSQPIRGVNLGGWLSIEPFIVPSLFDTYTSSEGIIDEWTLSKKLGDSAASVIEKHYATFITEQDFADIRDAGLDHVRIQFSYWAIKTYDGDPYVPKIAWRYLLRAIEYCRKYGLRVNLDPHGIPGSQNGWNHSGRQGTIGWLNGTDGELNRKRSLEIHDQLSQFFAQDRYKNVVTIYGLVNEPLMLSLPVEKVLNWTVEATNLVQKNGIKAWVTAHDGFLNLAKWDKMLKTRPNNMMLDTHQYTVFNTGEIVLNHTRRVELICESWYSMIQQINITSTGWGPTICGEWSQADTDCAQYVNNVGRGTRWEGTFSLTDSTQYCPTASEGTCSCTQANAVPGVYSEGYKTFLQTYAEAQMSAFETAMGWFYWTWATESAAQWSYRTAWKNGYMPKKAYSPAFKCGDAIPSFGNLPEYY